MPVPVAGRYGAMCRWARSAIGLKVRWGGTAWGWRGGVTWRWWYVRAWGRVSVGWDARWHRGTYRGRSSACACCDTAWERDSVRMVLRHDAAACRVVRRALGALQYAPGVTWLKAADQGLEGGDGTLELCRN